MAGSAGERTERATPRRREESRKRGQVARSREINTGLGLLATFALLSFLGGWLLAGMAEIMSRSLGASGVSGPITRAAGWQIMVGAGWDSLRLIAPFAAAGVIVGVVASAIQVKPGITPSVLTPRFSVLNPISGAKRLLGPRSLVSIVKDLIKVAATGAIAYVILKDAIPDLMSLMGAGPGRAIALVSELTMRIGFSIVAVYAFIAVADLLYERWQHERDLRMTRDEVRREAKEQDVNPEIKGQLKRRQREMAVRRMMSAVPDADVVITNPTHFAVALRYASVPGYRHVSNEATRKLFEKQWGVKLDGEPGLRIPNMFDEAASGTFKGLFVHGEDIAQSDPNTNHVTHALESMEVVVVQDLFLNETAAFAHVFFPGTSFLEKDGTFTNAERRVNRVRQVMQPKQGMAEWEIVCRLATAMGYPMIYTSAAAIMDEIAALTPTFKNISFKRLDELGSVQWPCDDDMPEGTPIMHTEEFTRGKGRFMLTEFVATSERSNRNFPLILTTGRILSQYNVGAQTRRTDNVVWYQEDILEMHPSDAEVRGIRDGSTASLTSRVGGTTMRVKVTDRVPPGVVYSTFHFPISGANVITTENSDWATNCPEYKVTAVQVTPSNHPSDWQNEWEERERENKRVEKPLVAAE